jgi:hypothetical protein
MAPPPVRPTYTGGRTVYDGQQAVGGARATYTGQQAVTGGRATYTGAPPPSAPAPAPAKSGGGGFFHDLLHSPVTLAEGAAGLGQAAYDLGKVIVKGDVGVVTGNQKAQQQASDTAGAYVKGVAKDYATRYSPLVHGQIGKFSHDVVHDPASYLLDAASLATLGGAGAAKAGEVLSKVGAISKESRLARLGVPTDITVPDWNGEHVTIKQSSPNPVTRFGQGLVNRGMQRLPENTPSVGTSARIVKAISPVAERAGAAVRLETRAHTQAFAVLNNTEKAAWHLAARGVHDPAAYKAFLLSNGEQVAPAMLKELDNPKLAEVLKNPSPRLRDAIAKGQAASDTMTAIKLSQGWDPQSLAESPYRTLRLMSGAKIVPHSEGVASPTLTASIAERDRLAALHERVLNQESAYHLAQQGRDLRGPMTDAQGQARLAALDQLHGELVQKLVPETSPYGGVANPRATSLADEKLAQLKELDAYNGPLGMFAKTKDDLYTDLVSSAAREIKWDKFPTKRDAVLDFWTRAKIRAEGRGAISKQEQLARNFTAGKTGVKPTTVKAEEAQAADAKLREVVANNPDHPVAQQAAALIAERDALRQQLNARGEASLAGTRPADLPVGGEHPVVPEQSNPYDNRIVELGIRLEAAQAKVDRLNASARTRQATETGVVGGKPVDQIAKELAAAGHQQPFYVPDSAVSSGTKGASRFRSKPSGFADPALPGSAKQNLGTLTSKGLLNFREDPLSREMGLLANRTEAQTLHDELLKHAAQLPKGADLPYGYEPLKVSSSEPGLTYTQRVAGELQHALDPGTADRFLARDLNDPAVATKDGHYLIVPSEVRRILEDKTLSYSGAARKLLLSQPTSVWKHLVIGLRPMSFFNISVGNSILGALQMAPGFHGFAGWLNQVVPGAERVLGSKLTRETMDHVFPNQSYGTFGGTSGFGKGAISGSTKLGRSASRAYQGVMPATIGYENVLRRAMVEGWAKAQPEVRALMHANGGDVNQALEDLAQTHPHVINEISKRTDDALGNYRSYNKFEQAVKAFIPFYGWDRHIVRSVARLAKERPALLDGLLQVGQVGQQRQTQQLGQLPPYMKGMVRLPGLPGFLGGLNGRTPLLNTQTLNPFNTAVDLARLPASLISNTPGSQEVVSGLNPIITALVEQLATHRDMLTGANLKQNAFLHELENIPQVRAILAGVGKLPPTKPTSLYQNDARTIWANLAALPVKKANLQTAHLYATQQAKGTGG